MSSWRSGSAILVEVQQEQRVGGDKGSSILEGTGEMRRRVFCDSAPLLWCVLKLTAPPGLRPRPEARKIAAQSWAVWRSLLKILWLLSLLSDDSYVPVFLSLSFLFLSFFCSVSLSVSLWVLSAILDCSVIKLWIREQFPSSLHEACRVVVVHVTCVSLRYDFVPLSECHL